MPGNYDRQLLTEITTLVYLHIMSLSQMKVLQVKKLCQRAGNNRAQSTQDENFTLKTRENQHPFGEGEGHYKK